MLDGLHERLSPHLAPLPDFEERAKAAESKRLAALEALLGIAWCEECGTYHKAQGAYEEPWSKHVGARGQSQANDPYPPPPV